MKPDKEKQPKTATPKKPNGKVFDVSRPGKTAASPTSKPVILGHKPEAQQAQASVSGIGDARPLLNRRKIEISPLGDLKPTDATPAADASAPKADEAHVQPTQEETDAIATAVLDAVTGPPPVEAKEPEGLSASPKLEIEPPVPAEPEKPVEAVKEEAEEKKETEPEPTPEPEAEQPAKSEPELEEKELPAETSSMPEAEPVAESEKDEEPAPEPKIEPLFDDSGAIVVSDHDHHHRNHGFKVFFLILLVLVLAAVALDVALDLGLLTIDGIPHTDYL